MQTFSKSFESVYGLCEVVLQEAPPGGAMENAANKEARLKALVKWKKRLNDFVMCTGEGSSTAAHGGPGVGKVGQCDVTPAPRHVFDESNRRRDMRDGVDDVLRVRTEGRR